MRNKSASAVQSVEFQEVTSLLRPFRLPAMSRQQVALLLALVCMAFNSQMVGTQHVAKEKLKVLVLYESLCPDSIRFMGNQLGPNYDALKDFIDVTLVPFGKSQSQNNGQQFFCQHGPQECLGNRRQSCVLQQTTNQEQQVKFAVCQMTLSVNADVQRCAELSGLSGDIDTCMNTELGTLLQLEAERITHAYAPKFVPTVIYDGVFDQQMQDNSIRDFRGTVCYMLQRRGDISFHSDVCQ